MHCEVSIKSEPYQLWFHQPSGMQDGSLHGGYSLPGLDAAVTCKKANSNCRLSN
jgi:hypothetical protein